MNDVSEGGNGSDRVARLVVWFVWLAMVVGLVGLYAVNRSNVPLAEDWLIVPAFTGHEPDFWGWLWSQNNEHRVPAPRLVTLAILHVTGGKFSAVGWSNVVLQSAVAAGLILFVRRLRGRTDVADAFFPLLLLHWGHSAHFLFPFLNSLLWPTAATLLWGCVLAMPEVLRRPWVALGAGIALILLPLCGLVGLLYVPVIAVLLTVHLVIDGRTQGSSRGSRTAWWVLAISMAVAVFVSGWYFIGYYTPWWNPPNPGGWASLRTALRVSSMGFGVAALEAPRPFIGATLLLWVATAGCLLRHGWSTRARERLHAASFGVLVASAVGFVLAVGWNRSGWEPQFGIPSRYGLFAVPAFTGCFLAWVRFGPGRAGRWVPRGLALTMLLLVPWNTRAGDRFFADWYRDGMRAFHRDLNAGVPIDELARRHQFFLYHAMKPETLAEHMRWLSAAGVAPFDRTVDTR